ncbi:MAG: aquaporin, partial [Acidimicrobiia bacterium]
LVHLISIPIDNTSVNPARSFATAIFAKGFAFEQLWVFIVFPAIGGLIGALGWQVLNGDKVSIPLGWLKGFGSGPAKRPAAKKAPARKAPAKKTRKR